MYRVHHKDFMVIVVLFGLLAEKNLIYRNFQIAASLPKKFYKNAGVLNCDGKYEITLDSRKLKTPNGDVFNVTNEPLAIASM